MAPWNGPNDSQVRVSEVSNCSFHSISDRLIVSSYSTEFNALDEVDLFDQLAYCSVSYKFKSRDFSVQRCIYCMPR